MPQCQQGFDDPGNSGRRLRVSNIRLDRANGRHASGWPILGEDRRQCAYFDGVTGSRAGPVCFDIANLARIHACALVGSAQHFDLPI
jgi:hypothetical protein